MSGGWNTEIRATRKADGVDAEIWLNFGVCQSVRLGADWG
jgi:hypothetical protein